MKLSHLRNIGFVICVSVAAQERPRITCMIIIDQGGANIINRVLPQCTDGLRWIYDHATRYADAHQPHGAPTTAPGHATLSTGAVAREHGIVGNNWYTRDGTQVRAEYDAQGNPTIDHLMVDTLADQAALARSPQRPITLINLSLKSRAALMMSGRTQSAWWYDTKTQSFAGLNAVPSWLLPISLKNIALTWHLRYPRDHAFYQSVNPASYQISCAPTLIGAACDGDECLKTPTAQRMLINALRTGIEEWKKNNIPGELICAISLSGLDKVGHTYGPASYESLDLLAWLDTDLLPLCKDIEAASEGKYCIVLSADHGVQPLIPVVQQAGYSPAHRMTPQELIAATHDDIIRVQQPFVYGKKSIPLKTISHDLESVRGILHATAVSDLDDSAPQIGSINHSLRNLIYPNRIGDVVLTRAPYTLIAGDECGTKHNSPYDYDTHIPLWIASPGNYDSKTIWDRVYAHQLAPTLAQLLEIPRPSASRTALLPR